MKRLIQNILAEELFLEGRLEQVKEKYSEYDSSGEWIDHFSENDPSGNNKYLSWMAKMKFENNIHQYDIIDGIKYFHENTHKFDIKDINQYRDWDSFKKAKENAELKKSRKELKEEGAEKVFENERYLVIRPKTHSASCKYGSNTRWCITMRDYANYFDNYTNRSSFFFVIDKVRREREPGMPRQNYYKVAIQYSPQANRVYPDQKEMFVNQASLNNSRLEYWNVIDRPVTEKTFRKYVGADTNPILEAIEKYMKNLHGKFYDKEFGDNTVSAEDEENLTEQMRLLQTRLVLLERKWSTLDYVLDYYDEIEMSIDEIDSNLYEVNQELNTDYDIDMEKVFPGLEEKINDTRTKRDRFGDVIGDIRNRIRTINDKLNKEPKTIKYRD